MIADEPTGNLDPDLSLEIMQLVGAPHAYIRGPFVMEGVIQGGTGAALAVVALGVVFAALQSRYLAPLAAAINMSSLQFLSVGVCVLLVLGGMAVGCIGGTGCGRAVLSRPIESHFLTQS